MSEVPSCFKEDSQKKQQQQQRQKRDRETEGEKIKMRSVLVMVKEVVKEKQTKMRSVLVAVKEKKKKMRSASVVVKENKTKKKILAHTTPGDSKDEKCLGGGERDRGQRESGTHHVRGYNKDVGGGEGGGVSKVDGESYPHTGDRTKLRGALVVDKESEAHTTPGEKTKMMGI